MPACRCMLICTLRHVYRQFYKRAESYSPGEKYWLTRVASFEVTKVVREYLHPYVLTIIIIRSKAMASRIVPLFLRNVKYDKYTPVYILSPCLHHSPSSSVGLSRTPSYSLQTACFMPISSDSILVLPFMHKARGCISRYVTQHHSFDVPISASPLLGRLCRRSNTLWERQLPFVTQYPQLDQRIQNW